jgi:hypothetical protein
MSKGGGSFIRGWRYFMGVHLVLGHGPWDKLTEIKIGGRVAWSGNNTGTPFTINEPNLFGGLEREGGVVGEVQVLMGKASQTPPAFLAALFPNCPAFRGLCSVLMPSLYYSANNPYPKKIEFAGVRTQVLTTDEPQWYAAKANIDDDMNPAHILRECQTNGQWGNGHSTDRIDDANFTAAADTLYAEGFGLSFYWANPGQMDSFISNVEAHINGRLRVNPETGKFEIKLIRDDYVLADLPVFNESNIVKVTRFQRNSWDGTINELTLIYYDFDKDQKIPVTVQDIGNQQIQGRKITKQIRMEGITRGALGTRVALRELRGISTPLSALEFTCNRSAWGLNLGDAFVWTWPKYGVNSVVYRVSTVDWGTLEDAMVTISAIEDVFALPLSSYLLPPQSAWVPDSTTPVAPIAERVVEASYWDVFTNLRAADIASLDPDYGFMAAMAVRANGRQMSFDLYTRIGVGIFTHTGDGPFCPSCLIASTIDQEVASTWTYSADMDISEVIVGRYAYINDEIVELTAIDTIAKSVTVNRGALDTVPVSHAAGSRIYFSERWAAFDRTERMATESIDAKLLTVTSSGVLDESAAATLNLVLDNRPQRPYPPGNIKLNGNRYPATTIGDIIITWAHRDRLQQTAYIVDQTEGNIGPEASTTYTIRIYNTVGNVLKHTESALTGVTWTYTQVARLADFSGAGPHAIRIEIESIIGALVSHQFHSLTISATDL